MNGPLKNPAGARGVRVMAAAGACLWVGLFLVLFRPAPPPSAAAPASVSRLLYHPRTEGDGFHPQPVGLWSPHLFSFPSSLGFSGFLDIRPTGLQPQLDPPEPETVFLNHAKLLSPPIPESGELPEQVRAFFVAQTRRPPPPRVPSSAAYDIRFLEGLSEEDFMDFSLPEPQAADAAGWHAQLEIEVLPGGEISHVFVMNETQPGGNRNRLVQAVRQWRGRPSDRARRGIVAVRIGALPQGGQP